MHFKSLALVAAFGLFITSGCATSGSGATGEIDREAIRQVVKSKNRAYSTCYENAIDVRPGAIGKAIVSWTILQDGTVASARLTEVDPSLVDIKECLVREISALKFAPHTLSEGIEVNYPMYFDERQSSYMDRVAPSQAEIKAADTNPGMKLPPDSTGATVPNRTGDIEPSKMSGLPSRKGDKSSISSQPSKPPGPQPSPVVLPMPVPVSPSGN